jgi:hypothetical protein
MTVPDLADPARTAIVDRWLELTLEVYPEESARFMKREKDRFGNPVGQLTRESLAGLFEALLEGRAPEQMRESLDPVVRIRAIQELPPSTAVGFVFLLKRALREVLGETATEPARLDARIEGLALQAFDQYVQCREQIYDLRAHELRRRTASLLERLARNDTEAREGNGRPQPDPTLKGGCGA